MRESLRERGVLRDHLQQYAHSRADKLLRQPRVTVEPMRNYLDVSVGAQAQPSLVLAEHWGPPGVAARG